MKRRSIIIVGGGVAVALVVLSGFRAFQAPRLNVRVVDEGGRPVRGARITPDGIRGTDGGHYHWGEEMAVKPAPVVTDEEGWAAIPYPKYIVERVRSIELSFGVKQPDFGSERPFVPVASPLTSTTGLKERLLYLWEDLRRIGRVETIRLKRAGTVVVRARWEGRRVADTNVFVMLEAQEGIFDGEFQREDDRLVSKQVPAGLFLLRAVWIAGRTNYFSMVESGLAAARETNFFDLELEPGLTVTGRLAGVEGPVTNGWINALVLSAKPNLPGAREELVWGDYAEVKADGTFALSGLPPGRLECAALCDGYLSKRPSGATSGYEVLPVESTAPQEEELVLEMERSAVARVEVHDPEGKPLAGARVLFWPNIQWARRWSTIFATDFHRTSEALARTPVSATRAVKREFSATTDETGVAWIRELPPGFGRESRFAVTDARYVLPLNAEGDRSERIRLMSGRTNYASVRLQEKGEEQRE